MLRVLSFLLFTASSLQAQGFDARENDIQLDAAGLSDIILGRELTFFDGGKARYAAGGSYSWTYSTANGGGSWYGTHQMADDGTVCIEFRRLRSRCDMFVMSGERLVLLTEDGQRYPIRDIR